MIVLINEIPLSLRNFATVEKKIDVQQEGGRGSKNIIKE
jgi:hypothetical protein